MDELQKEKLELYDRLIQTNPDVERKGNTMPYTSVNGQMFTQLSKTGTLGIRLPKEERDKFLKKYKTTLFESYGAVMKEYVAVPENLLEKTDELKEYFDVSYQYVSRLKPKASKKKH